MSKIIFAAFISSSTLISFCGLSYGAWWIDPWDGTSKSEKRISDSRYNFKAKDLDCWVSKTKFTRVSNNSVVEYRDLACKVAPDTIVDITVTCNFPLYEMIQLKIYKNDDRYVPTLTCGPEKK